MWETFLKSFIPMFVALDVLGVLPLYVRFARNLDKPRRRRVLRDSMVTAFLVTVGFVGLGREVMHYLGITMSDFMAAGGIILFILAAKELVSGAPEGTIQKEDLFAVVPLGVPLLAGPAVLTTSLIVYNVYGVIYFIISLVVNLLIAVAVFWYSGELVKLVGSRWVEAISKVFMLLLAAIAVMFIRTGITGVRLP